MGNSIGGKKTTKIMKIDGQTMKLKTPIKVGDVVKDYPGHVVLDSVAVKQYGVRAKPLDPFSNLEPKRLYFLVELPKFPQDHQHRVPRRVRSAIQMSAKDRLENLLLSRRSVSDLSIMGPATMIEVDETHNSAEGGQTTSGGLRVKMRLPKAEVERLMSQSRNKEEVAEKIMNMYSSKTGQNILKTNVGNGIEKKRASLKGKEVAIENNFFDHSLGRRSRADYKSQKRVGFMPIHEGVAVAAS
ncbi:hypothetical protein RND81_07G032800 [Saponaria officinalis]|uniref:Uncharacterized protein n=1 Tax=Saponaria officinalis TaxID=3572 RepID=A0AAW1JKD1_SAPOF